MKQCWSEGHLRAYLDREVPSEEMQQIAAHLESCSDCGDHWAEIAGRASRISALMDTLSVPERVVSIAEPRRVAKTPSRKWVGAALALAAGVILGIIALPKAHSPVERAVSVAPPTHEVIRPVEPVESVLPQAPRMMNAMATPARNRAARPAHRPAASEARSTDDFVSLDDEPISTGVVLRVELGPRGVPADVIFGSDGRPHAIRLVHNNSNR
jgi:hypothetical protein